MSRIQHPAERCPSVLALLTAFHSPIPTDVASPHLGSLGDSTPWRRVLVLWVAAVLVFLTSGAFAATTVNGESLVLAGELPSKLTLKEVSEVIVRSDYKAGKGLTYEEGQDYIVDREAGEIRRTPGSRIPDYSNHALYGAKSFDHREFEGKTSNIPYFVWVDYVSSAPQAWAEPRDESAHLARARRKLEQGGKFYIATYGDSITAGGEASRPDLSFTQLYINDLRSRYPKADIVHRDVSIPGKTSREAVSIFDEKLGGLGPQDLVLIGFGMNDHNRGGAEPGEFQDKLAELVRLTRVKSPDADVILFSAFPPNVAWKVATNRMGEYAAATREAAAANSCAYADVFGVWERVLQRKDQSSMLANNINHPNNFGHWLYFQALAGMGL